MKQLRARYFDYECARFLLTHWGRVTHICVGKLSIIGSHNALSPGRRPSIIWTNAGILLIGPLGTNFSENWIGIEKFSIKEMHLKMSAKWRLFGLGLNELIGPLGTNVSEIIIVIYIFSFRNMHFNMSFVKLWAFWFGLNVLIGQAQVNVEARLSIIMTERPHVTGGPGCFTVVNELTKWVDVRLGCRF